MLLVYICVDEKVGFVIIFSRLCVLLLLCHITFIYANELAGNESLDSQLSDSKNYCDWWRMRMAMGFVVTVDSFHVAGEQPRELYLGNMIVARR
jgi:hypothetical protein